MVFGAGAYAGSPVSVADRHRRDVDKVPFCFRFWASVAVPSAVLLGEDEMMVAAICCGSRDKGVVASTSGRDPIERGRSVVLLGTKASSGLACWLNENNPVPLKPPRAFCTVTDRSKLSLKTKKNPFLTCARRCSW